MELRRRGGVRCVGHRGAAALAPENSLAAIDAAAELGADVVELDVLARADGVLVLAHGPALPAAAPTLGEALALVAELGLEVQLDLKVRGIESAVAAAVRRSALLERTFVSSFSLPILAAFAVAEPSLPRSVTYPEDRFGLSGRPLPRPLLDTALAALRAALPRRLPRWLRAVDASAATLNSAVVTRRAVDVCHGLGAAVYVWTVNDPALARTLVEIGTDGIITDDPRILSAGTHLRS